MSVRKIVAQQEGLYFITITCSRWIHLFDEADAYSSVYKWFDYLKTQDHYICGYVIMPNHLHALLGFRNSGKTINSIVGNGKRFMAYDIVTNLKSQGKSELLDQLSSWVNDTDRSRGKQHEVFEPSFDCKECYSDQFIGQKLDYIHNNPCRGKWNLAEDPVDYLHSSARFYFTGETTGYGVLSPQSLLRWACAVAGTLR